MHFLEKHAPIAALFFSGVMIFAALAVIRSVGTSPFDISFFSFTHRIQSPIVTDIMILISDILSPLMLSLVSSVMTGFLIYTKRYRWAVFFCMTMACALLSVLLLKDIFQIARPVDQIIPEVGWGFPSGHATAAAVFLLTYLYAIYEKVHKHAAMFLWGIVAFVLLISVGVSRVYLGVHFATDVLAGFALGTSWASLGILVFERQSFYGTKDQNNS